MTIRKTAVLAAQLPQGARIYLEVGDDRAWTEGDHLVAELVDVERIALWQRAGDKNATKPKPLPRPSDMAKLRENNEKVSRQAEMFREREKRRAELRERATPEGERARTP